MLARPACDSVLSPCCTIAMYFTISSTLITFFSYPQYLSTLHAGFACVWAWVTASVSSAGESPSQRAAGGLYISTMGNKQSAPAKTSHPSAATPIKDVRLSQKLAHGATYNSTDKLKASEPKIVHAMNLSRSENRLAWSTWCGQNTACQEVARFVFR